MKNIRSLSLEELTEYLNEKNQAKYRAMQIFTWLHKNMVESFDEMTNINKELRHTMSEDFNIFMPTVYKRFDSKLDDTKKYLLKLEDDNIIECVLMKYKFGLTLCISSQVGCNMGCKFCASTIEGAVRNLTPDEMLSQVYRVEKDLNVKISNVVIMGSGEPLINYDNVIKFLNLINQEAGNNISLRNITLSTCGIVPKINDLKKLNLPITLALSLHAPNQNIRQKIMPIANKYDFDETLFAMQKYFEKTNRRITIEYSLMKNINSDIECAKELAKVLNNYFTKNKVDFNVNLIPVNEVKETKIQKPSQDTVKTFQQILESKHINVTIRRTLGQDISGSCGQLRRSFIESSKPH